MSTIHTVPGPARRAKRGPKNPLAANLPDPRAGVDYQVEVGEYEGKTALYVYLDQPCVIRAPVWRVINALSGEVRDVAGASIGGDHAATVALFVADGVLDRAYNLLEAPPQDPEIQSYRGGFVRPGATWFRPPV
jgi:hypothetical protein